MPPAVVDTLSFPLVAPSGTVTDNLLADNTVGADTSAPVRCTTVEASKPEPLIVTTPATAVAAGEKVETAGTTSKESALVVVPPAFATVIGPETADEGTVVFSWVPPARTLKPAATGVVRPV